MHVTPIPILIVEHITSPHVSITVTQERNNVTGEITDNGLTGVITDSTRTLNRRTLKIKIKGSITEDDGYYYYYGVKRDPQLSVKINNVNHPLSIVF